MLAVVCSGGGHSSFSVCVIKVILVAHSTCRSINRSHRNDTALKAGNRSSHSRINTNGGR